MRCNEFWVVGVNRYRNPDKDLPADFETERPVCYRRTSFGVFDVLPRPLRKQRAAILKRELPAGAPSGEIRP